MPQRRGDFSGGSAKTSSPRLVLASASPRRRQLLEEAGYRFAVEPADIDEEAVVVQSAPADLPRTLAERKAEVVAGRHAGERAVVLAADTVVYAASGQVLNKPADRADARRMLGALSGSLHRVVTGYCAVRCDWPLPAGRRSGVVRSDVLMRPLSPGEVEAYLDIGAWQGKAGAYGIQDTPGRDIGAGDPFIEAIGGELTNIVGLPMPQVIDVLEEMGVVRNDE